MTRQSFLDALHDTKRVHPRVWFVVYFLSIITPFVYILLLSFKQPGQTIPPLLDLFLTIMGIFCILVTFRAIVQMFWTAINSHTLTSEKISRLILTYLYMLFAFAGIYFVLYFDSDFSLAQRELTNLSGGPTAAQSPASLAFSGVDLRFWPTVGLPIEWTNLPLIYLDLLYFSASTLTTLGFGDIVAKFPFVKILVIIEALFGNLLLVLGVASIVPRRNTEP